MPKFHNRDIKKMSLLKVSEVFCYICRGVLIEPVTLPCSHVFCNICFEQSMQETSHSCPLCRKRISNWIRTVKKSNKLINTELWEKIKQQFKEQVNMKLNGEDDGLDSQMQRECKILIPTSKPGEVAKEFSKFLNDFKSEQEKIKEAEELASKKLIQELEIEEKRMIHHIKEKNWLLMKEDEQLAKRLQEEIEKETYGNMVCESRKHRTRKKNTSKGPMDNFLNNLTYLKKRKSYKQSLSIEPKKQKRSTSLDSTDSLKMEMNLFRPIKKASTTPPKKYPDGKIREINLTKVTPLKLSFNEGNQSSSDNTTFESKSIHSSHSAFVDTNYCNKTEGIESSSKRLKYAADGGNFKYGSSDEDKSSNSNSIAQDENHTSAENIYSHDNFIIPSLLKYCSEGKNDKAVDNFDTQDYLNPSPTLEEKLIEEQMRIENIIIQEKKDRELALKLSQEWELEKISKKPHTRSMISSALKKKNNIKNTKLQKTLLQTTTIYTKNQKS